MNNDAKIAHAFLAWMLALLAGMCISFTFSLIYNPAAGFAMEGIFLLVLALIAAKQATGP